MTGASEIAARLESAELAELLVAAWDGFSFLMTRCQESASRSPDLFAPFAFAAAAAAEGRLLIDSAPSLPAGYGQAAPEVTTCAIDPDEAADELAGLARTLGARLSRAARQAPDPGDREACAEAAASAAYICELLERNG